MRRRDEAGMMISKKQRTGDLTNPKDDGSSKAVVVTKSAKFVDDAVYRLYFKGLVSRDEVNAAEGGKKTTAVVAGFGVAICDQRDQLLFEVKETVRDKGGMIKRREVEIRALIRGLSEAHGLGIRNVVIYCKDTEIYQ